MRLHKLPKLSFGLQAAWIIPGGPSVPKKGAAILNLSIVDIIEPIKTEVGSISILASSLKSKSTRLTAAKHWFGSPQNGEISTVLSKTTIWGRVSKSTEELNLSPPTCSGVALPILIKSWGVNENSPMSLRSKFITITWSPKGTPIII